MIHDGRTVGAGAWVRCVKSIGEKSILGTCSWKIISPGIIAFTLYTKVQKYLGASLTGFTLYIFSIYSAIYGIILFDEALLNFHYFGAAFVFAGVYLARKTKS